MATSPPCVTCTSTVTTKYGKTRTGHQVYWCKPCKKRFTLRDTMPGRRMPPEQVGAAVSMFYSGLSVKEVSQHLAPIFDIPPPSKATIYEWVVDYTRLAKNVVGQHRAHTGDTWVADEMVVKIGGRKYWNWNVMDAKTRFLLASRLSSTRGTTDAAKVFRDAAMAAHRPPKTIITDRLASYIDGIERVFGSDSKHVQSQGLRAEVNNNLSERLQGTIRRRTKVMRGMQRRDTAQLIMDGWNIYYNFFRPHESLRNRTPSELARIDVPFKNWEDVARLDVRPFSKVRIMRSREFQERHPKGDVFVRSKSRL